MIPLKFQKFAAESLPNCRRLSELEKALGAEFELGIERDWTLVARVWGCWDGYQGNPKTWNGVDHAGQKLDYMEAFALGQRLSVSRALVS